jgi:hypothetical protein
VEIAVVVTVIVTDEAVDPFNVTELGETPHVARDGTPEQLKGTVWSKPPAGETDTE